MEKEKYYVYALKAETRDYIYVGITNDINRRVSEHNKGYNKTTKPYRPFTLIYQEECRSRIEARKREKYFKGGSGRKKLRKLINN